MSETSFESAGDDSVSPNPASALFSPAPASGRETEQSSAAAPAPSAEGEIPPHRVVGELFRTYIIVEIGESLLLIDKHAAHERMNFDRMKQRSGPAVSQQLLEPQVLRLDPEERELTETFSELFRDFGFLLEPFGEEALILRAVPADLLPGDAVPALEEILEALRTGGSPDPAAARDEILHTVACKAAIKAGWKTGAPEWEHLAREVLSGRIRYCPHGRPVSVRMEKKELDRMFSRIL